MKHSDNSKESKFIFVGILFTSALILAAFTYSKQELYTSEDERSSTSQITYQFENIKKPKIKLPQTKIEKSHRKEKTINLKKDVSANSKKVENKKKSDNNNVQVKGINLKFDPEIKYKVIDIIPEIVDFPDYEASFIGGFAEMTKYIIHNLNLNRLDQFGFDNEMVVHVEFVVSSEGKISDVKTKEEIPDQLKDEITRMIKGMPTWIPAEFKGRKVNSRVNLPIRIHLQ